MPFDGTTTIVADQLEKAAQIVEQGWCQHTLKKGNKHCMLGALAATRGMKYEYQFRSNKVAAHVTAVVRALGLEPDLNAVNLSSVCAYNNATGRTQQECADLLRKAKEHV